MKIKINSIFPEYELIDCGNSRKLERFGEIVLIRPEITAIEKPKLTESEWHKLANAKFIETSKNSGTWKIYREMPQKWKIKFESGKINIRAELALTNSKHIGVFPEQVLNWIYINQICHDNNYQSFLNLFGYTGLASVAAAPFCEVVTHVDSIKKVVDWTKQNAQNSGYDNVRCITEDALKFVERELKRGNKYNGIILDPPSIGTGTNKEKWILENKIDDLLTKLTKILEKDCFVIMNLYSHSVNDKFIHRLILTYFSDFVIDFQENIFGLSSGANEINHGFFVRLRRKG
jgi:23S rRNA (cytosine1962-C5)-methyltransferase